MKGNNQINTAKAFEEALIPGSSLIDGRTEMDWLCFLSDFSSLIKFFDDNNKENGKWQSVLQKDPVFLLTSISKTDTTTFHIKYIELCTRLEKYIQKNDPDSIGDCFNKLFDLIDELFNCIQHWTWYMGLSHEKYQLKDYVFHQVENIFSGYFWALISLRKDLISAKMFNQFIIPKKSNLSYDFSEDSVWTPKKDKLLYFEVLGLQHPIELNTPPGDLLLAMRKIGNELFYFLNTIIHHSSEAFEGMNNRNCNNKEIVLLRAFVKLLIDEQPVLNKISKKHLLFYYKEILKQEELSLIEQELFSIDENSTEKELKIYRSIANRIKTKDRVVSKEDYFRLIRQEFPDIYYSTTIYNVSEKCMDVFVVQAVKNITEPNACKPLMDERKKSEIQKHLTERAPAFYNIRVLEFFQNPVQVTVQVILKKEFDAAFIKDQIINALNLFLSPWILENTNKTFIGQSISDDQVAVIIQHIEGIEKVQTVSFNCGSNSMNEIRSAGENYMLVSSMEHTIQFISPI